MYECSPRTRDDSPSSSSKRQTRMIARNPTLWHNRTLEGRTPGKSFSLLDVFTVMPTKAQMFQSWFATQFRFSLLQPEGAAAVPHGAQGTLGFSSTLKPGVSPKNPLAHPFQLHDGFAEPYECLTMGHSAWTWPAPQRSHEPDYNWTSMPALIRTIRTQHLYSARDLHLQLPRES